MIVIVTLAFLMATSMVAMILTGITEVVSFVTNKLIYGE